MKQTNFAKSIFVILLFFAFIAVAAILKAASSVFIPITMAILLSFVFYPIVKTMNRKAHLPWFLGILLIGIVAAIIFYIISNLLISSIEAIASVYPKYENRFLSLYKLAADTFNMPFDESSSLIANLWQSFGVRNFAQGMAVSLSSNLMTFAKSVLIVALFILFLLLEMNTMKTKINTAFNSDSMKTKVLAISTKTIQDTTHYISIKFLVSLITGILVFLCCLIVKMDFPIIWGFLAFILNFIPTFGSIISWGATTLFALLQFYPSWGAVLFISISVLAINFILGNIIEPRWEGNDLGLSPFIILVALNIWGWMWGFVGMILAVPIMVIIKIICENIEILSPIAILLGNPQKKTKRKLKEETAPVDSVNPEMDNQQ